MITPQNIDNELHLIFNSLHHENLISIRVLEKLKRCEPTTSLKSLGLDSLALFILSTKIETQLNVKIMASELAELQTLDQLLKLINIRFNNSTGV